MTPPTGNAAPSQRITFSNRPIHCIFTPALITYEYQREADTLRLVEMPTVKAPDVSTIPTPSSRRRTEIPVGSDRASTEWTKRGAATGSPARGDTQATAERGASWGRSALGWLLIVLALCVMLFSLFLPGKRAKES